ncbi:hypothetical protein EDB84DRAFT_1434802 [Lactarius hengduanensis]|nr:hypothetical protein EDB84DRAFT_1434802 [Lactarius hengduanensis]
MLAAHDAHRLGESVLANVGCEGHVRSRRQGCSSARATGVSGVSGLSVIGVDRVSGSEGSRDAPEKVSGLPAGPYIATKDELPVVNPGTTGYMWHVILGWYLWSTLVLMGPNVYVGPGTPTRKKP